MGNDDTDVCLQSGTFLGTIVTHHDGVHKCHDADGPDGAETRHDDEDEVILGLRALRHGGVPGGGAAQARLGRGQRGGDRQLPDRARPYSHSVAVLVGLQALVAVHVDGEGGGHLHPVPPGLRGQGQEFLRLLGLRGRCASSSLTQVGLEEVGVRVDGHDRISVESNELKQEDYLKSKRLI